MTDARPDPDALLAQVKAQEASARRGRLRIYFGASAGVGKTYAMLEAAQKEKKAGRDVVIGYVETHGRKETDALTEGLPLDFPMTVFQTLQVKVKAHAAEVCPVVARRGHQIFGAISYCEEHPLHLFHKRIQAAGLEFGDSSHHLETVARAIGLAP
jgi:alkylation response protein AidB-like acyl-CoA dehydrogenase